MASCAKAGLGCHLTLTIEMNGRPPHECQVLFHWTVYTRKMVWHGRLNASPTANNGTDILLYIRNFQICLAKSAGPEIEVRHPHLSYQVSGLGLTNHSTIQNKKYVRHESDKTLTMSASMLLHTAALTLLKRLQNSWIWKDILVLCNNILSYSTQRKLFSCFLYNGWHVICVTISGP